MTNKTHRHSYYSSDDGRERLHQAIEHPENGTNGDLLYLARNPRIVALWERRICIDTEFKKMTESMSPDELDNFLATLEQRLDQPAPFREVSEIPESTIYLPRIHNEIARRGLSVG